MNLYEEVLKEIKESAYNTQQIQEQAAKADGGKIHPSWVSPKTIIAIAKIREYGTEKYGSPDNWKSVSTDRYHNALLRHVLGMWEDPYAIDPESGFPHLYHLMCNGNFLVDREGEELNGRMD
jgi:hypothetical protein